MQSQHLKVYDISCNENYREQRHTGGGKTLCHWNGKEIQSVESSQQSRKSEVGAETPRAPHLMYIIMLTTINY